jgi:hypothetical protein
MSVMHLTTLQSGIPCSLKGANRKGERLSLEMSIAMDISIDTVLSAFASVPEGRGGLEMLHNSECEE